MIGTRDQIVAYRAERPAGEKTAAVTRPDKVLALVMALLGVPDIRVVASPAMPDGQIYLMPDPDDQPLVPPPGRDLGPGVDRAYAHASGERMHLL